MDGSKGTALWNIVKEAGAPWDIGPGNPNLHERIESGLLSWGGDTDDQTNPFEVRMERYVDLDVPDDTVGIDALRRVKADGPKRHQLGVILDGDVSTPSLLTWTDITRDGRKVGDLTNKAWSYRLRANIGFALVSVDAVSGDRVELALAGGGVPGRLVDLPFI